MFVALKKLRLINSVENIRKASANFALHSIDFSIIISEVKSDLSGNFSKLEKSS